MRKARSRSTQQYLKLYLILAVVILVTFVVCRWAWGHYDRYTRAQELYEEVSRKHKKTQDRLQEVQERNRSLETPIGRQDLLVDRFALKKPGERVLILVEDDSKEVVVEEEKAPSLWERWFAQ